MEGNVKLMPRPHLLPWKGPPISIEEVSGWAPEQIRTPWRLALLFFLLGIEAQFLGHPNHTLVHPLINKRINKLICILSLQRDYRVNTNLLPHKPTSSSS